MTDGELTDPTDLSSMERHGKLKGKLRFADKPLTAKDVANNLGWNVDRTEAILQELAAHREVEQRPDGYEYPC